mmetsp:Transcript_68190/g.121087  ORF Transcript_68190/g.121087 Transcript_68190/m.121087 type:complete len:853 (-) Transcript_68190:64-2622(-)
MRGVEGEDEAGRAKAAVEQVSNEATEGTALPKDTQEPAETTDEGKDQVAQAVEHVTSGSSYQIHGAPRRESRCHRWLSRTCHRHCPILFRSLPFEDDARKLYNSQSVQLFIAVMIFANFIQSAAKAQFLFEDGIPQPEDSLGSKAFYYSEIFFASVFTIELCVNIYANWLYRFFADPWNIFDLFIVIISVISIGVPDMPAISVLRLFRAFRAFRLFKRISSLRVIVVGAFRCLPSVSYAFVVLSLITGIWSIMAVEFYGNPEFCEGLNQQLDLSTVSCMDMFGQFSFAMLTMFQVTTFDSWSSGVMRPMVLSLDSMVEQLKLGIFFISYVFATAIILTNVVVAILLDKFLAASEELVEADFNEMCPDNEEVATLAHPDAVKDRLLKAVGNISKMLHDADVRIKGHAHTHQMDTEHRRLLPKLMYGSGKPNGHLQTCCAPEELKALHDNFDEYAIQIQRAFRGYAGKVRAEQAKEASGHKGMLTTSTSFLVMKQTWQNAQQALISASKSFKSSVSDSFMGRTWRRSQKIKLPFQDAIKKFYEWKSTQAVVAGLIFINFFVSIVKAELNPLTDPQKDVFDVLEAVFGFLFLFELIINLWGNWLIRFWSDPWNIFDFLVVVISILAVFVPTMPGVSVLRLFRAFRAFRLFKRIEQLKRIVFGALKSLPRVSYAFAILIMIMGIWSIMAVEFYGKESPELFGNFFLSMLTLFQVMTFDSWSSGVARPVIVNKKGGPTAGIFFICYVFIASIIMVNVVIAIFVDQFLNNEPEHDEDNDPDSITETSVSHTLTELEHDMTSELIKIRRILARHVKAQNPELKLNHEKTSLKFVQGLRSRMAEIDTASKKVSNANSGPS